MNRGPIYKCHLGSLRLAVISWVYICVNEMRHPCIICHPDDVKSVFQSKMGVGMTTKPHKIPRWKPSQIPFRETRLMLKPVTSSPLERDWVMSHSQLIVSNHYMNRWINLNSFHNDLYVLFVNELVGWCWLDVNKTWHDVVWDCFDNIEFDESKPDNIRNKNHRWIQLFDEHILPV